MSKLSEKFQEVLGETAEYWAQTLGGLPTGEAVSDWISEVLIPDILEIAQAHETEDTHAVERMRERAAVFLDLDADDQSTSADEWHQKMARKLRRLAAAIRALPTDGE